MKKIMIAATLAISAISVNASTVKWGFTSGSLDTTKFADGTAYLICVSDIARPTFTDDAAAQTWYKANSSNLGTSALRTTAVTAGAVSASEVIESPTGRKQYWLAVVNADETALAVSTINQAINIQSGTMNISAQWSPSSQMKTYELANVPEPTSALLLMLGVAGLMLRRKQR